jgi:hypothetical protein
MNQNLEKQIEELKKRIEVLEGKTEPEPCELPFWMPKLGESYWHANEDGDILDSLCQFDAYDKRRIELGNYAETKEILDKRKAKLKLLEEIKQWRGKHDPDSFKLDWTKQYSKWEVVYDTLANEWKLKETACEHNPLSIHLSFVCNAADFLKYFGNRLDILLEVD